jgi:hypothetical protein
MIRAVKLHYFASSKREPDRQAPEPELEKVLDPDGIGSIDLDPAEIDEKKLRRLFDHWDSARQGRPWLSRADFRPELCPSVLPHLALIERRRDAIPSLHIRLTGEEIANPGFGFVKGGYVERIVPAWYRDHLLVTCLTALTSGEVHYQLVRAVYDYQVILYRRLILPVTLEGESVDMLLVAAVRTRRLADFIAAGRELG